MCFDDDDLSLKMDLEAYEKEWVRDFELGLCKTNLASYDYLVEKLVQTVTPLETLSDSPTGRCFQSLTNQMIELLIKELRVDLMTYANYFYDQTKNPLFAWDLFKMCKQWGQPVPDWVNEYLVDCASTLLNFANNGWPQGKRPADFIPMAIGLSDGQHARSVFTQYKIAHFRLTVYLTVIDVEKELADKDFSRQRGVDKFMIAAERLKKSPDHVKKVFYSEKKAIESLGAKM